MTTAVTFDTLDAHQRLIAAGFSDVVAKTVVQVLLDSQCQLATKNDLVLLEQRLIIKLGTLMAVIVGIAVAVLRLPH